MKAHLEAKADQQANGAAGAPTKPMLIREGFNGKLDDNIEYSLADMKNVITEIYKTVNVSNGIDKKPTKKKTVAKNDSDKDSDSSTSKKKSKKGTNDPQSSMCEMTGDSEGFESVVASLWERGLGRVGRLV